ncbi:Putative hemin ABC transporter, permease protein [gamma proteobacterium HdN1]|nr:Putative hemin ABC transporter, permease protein [gamma proteobacterium HdN1]
MKRLSFQFEIFLVFALAVTFTLALVSGAVSLPVAALLPALSDASSADGMIVWELRLPRILLAMAVGAALAGSGALAQGLFRNPLADPGLLGVSSGAAVGAALVIVLASAFSAWLADSGLAGSAVAASSGLSSSAIAVGACLGAALCTWCVYLSGRSQYGLHVTRMLLVGVAINALVSAVMAFLSYFSNDQSLRNLTFWLLGSFNGAGWGGVGLVSLGLVVLIFFGMRYASALNVLSLGESEARHLGIRVHRLQQGVILAVAVAVGLSVAVTGVIGFVGLVVPHVVRMLCGPDHRRLIPASLLLGALVVLLADLAARTLLSPSELPVGIFTALVGAPFFVALVIRSRRDVW